MNGSVSPEPQSEAQLSGGSKKNPKRLMGETALTLKIEIKEKLKEVQ